MTRNSDPNSQALQQLVAVFLKLPWQARVAVGLLLIGVIVYALSCSPQSGTQPTQPSEQGPPGSKTVLFCHWNMENLFDDHDDKRRQPDEDYDQWFINKPEDRTAKYDKLASWLLKQNGGIGPDVIVGNEIESLRAAELLQQRLNAGLPAGAAKYEFVAMKEIDAGRHIAPCVISRYPLSGAKLISSRRRILEVQVSVNGHLLSLIASHWTSQLTDKGTGKEGTGRDGYAHAIYDEYVQELKANPKVDLLICGDFNDTPESDPVVKALHVVADPKLVTPEANPPVLLGLLSGKSPEEFGTHYYSKPLIYDHIVVSPGLLDNAGWNCVVNSVQVPTDGLIRQGSKGRRPWRFGSANDNALGRGYSDHFPVMVTLKVSP
jgi:endonuclease/exonuclease/phosphatase family metal-dependent hydrolase